MDSHDEEEDIKVAFRLRPLESSTNSNRVWRVLPKYNSVTQTASDGKPLAERVTGRTFFTFDKTFGENTSTVEVYDNIAKGIVKSVVNGLNGTIFAYGNTNSGKTFTMQGSAGYGGIVQSEYDDESVQVPGIVQLAAKDIFDNINNNDERTFLVRVSYIEIYNEEVRDLIGSGAGQFQVLAIRGDPRLGVFVNSHEIIVSSVEGLVDILLAGEKKRAVASTGVNERSSRSHSIFRIAIESRNISMHQDDDVDTLDCKPRIDNDDDGAVIISTLNLVDLAGSESVRHTGATGERQKEGGKINQSLLSLSRVIFSLGQQNHSHINFRDSKLTRILQPSLSGNARMAVICCATPSEVFLEETRSSLQFASRAKLVKTRAQINEVLDDHSLIKKLRKELAEAKKAAEEYNVQKALKSVNEESNHLKPHHSQNENDGINNKVKMQMRMEKLVSKNEIMKSKIIKLSLWKENLEREIYVLKNDTNRFKSNMKAVQKELYDRSRKVMVENEEMTSQTSVLKSVIVTLEDKVSQLQYDFQKVSTKHMKSTHEFVAKSNEMKSKVMNFESINDGLKNENTFLGSDNKVMISEINQLTQVNDELEQHIFQLTKNKDKLPQLTKQNEEMEHEISRLKCDIDQIKCKNTKLNQDMDSKNSLRVKSSFFCRIMFKILVPFSLLFVFAKFSFFSRFRPIFS